MKKEGDVIGKVMQEGAVQVSLPDPSQKSDRLPSQLFLHWRLSGEVSPIHRKAKGSLWCSTDRAGNSRYTVDRLGITVEIPNLTGGTERNTDDKRASQVDAHVEAYGPPAIPSFKAKYFMRMEHGGIFNWRKDDELDVP
jgi:hypothetical protein